MKSNSREHRSKSEFVQPAYDKWLAVQIGMSRGDVIATLGPPLEDDCYGGKTKFDSPYYRYGHLQMPMTGPPRTYAFLIGFDADGKVFTKLDPFNGKFSVDGSPTPPELIIPVNNTVFSHFPRILDCRWYPSSGVYPIKYTIELGWGHPPFDPKEFHDDVRDCDLEVPFFITAFGGASPGRFRVKARNKLGESDWSEHRYFKFTV